MPGLGDERGPRLGCPQRRLDQGMSRLYGEVVDLDTSRQEVEASQLPDVPLIVLTGGRGPYSAPELLDEHSTIVAPSPQARRVIVPNSGHQIHQDQPDAVIAAIRELLEAAQSGGPRQISLGAAGP